MLDAINQYPPVLGINGLAAIAFMVGYALFGIAMTRSASLPRLAGMLVAVGGPAHLLGFGLAQLVSPALWPIAVIGSLSLGAGLALAGHRLWRTPARWQGHRQRDTTMIANSLPRTSQVADAAAVETCVRLSVPGRSRCNNWGALRRPSP